MQMPIALAYYKHDYYIAPMPQELIGYLIGDTGRMIRKEFDERARAIGMTGPQWRLLVQLKRHPGIKQAQLAELLEVEPISLSRMIDRLQEAGFVERRADPTDRRAWCLLTTETAKPLIDKIYAIAEELHVELLEGVTNAEQDKLRELLERIRNNFSPTPMMRKAANG